MSYKRHSSKSPLKAPRDELRVLSEELNALHSIVSFIPSVPGPFPLFNTPQEAFSNFLSHYKQLVNLTVSFHSKIQSSINHALEKEYKSLYNRHEDLKLILQQVSSQNEALASQIPKNKHKANNPEIVHCEIISIYSAGTKYITSENELIQKLKKEHDSKLLLAQFLTKERENNSEMGAKVKFLHNEVLKHLQAINEKEAQISLLSKEIECYKYKLPYSEENELQKEIDNETERSVEQKQLVKNRLTKENEFAFKELQKEKEKELELEELRKGKELELEELRKGKELELEELRKEQELELNQILKEKDFELEELRKEKEFELNLMLKGKDEEIQRLMNEKELEVNELSKEKDTVRKLHQQLQIVNNANHSLRGALTSSLNNLKSKENLDKSQNITQDSEYEGKCRKLAESKRIEILESETNELNFQNDILKDKLERAAVQIINLQQSSSSLQNVIVSICQTLHLDINSSLDSIIKSISKALKHKKVVQKHKKMVDQVLRENGELKGLLSYYKKLNESQENDLMNLNKKLLKIETDF